MSIERQAARFLTDVADALSAIKSGKTSYGEFYVSEARISSDGEESGFRVIPNDHGDYDIEEVQR
jgi:hypothetical protein